MKKIVFLFFSVATCLITLPLKAQENETYEDTSSLVRDIFKEKDVKATENSEPLNLAWLRDGAYFNTMKQYGKTLDQHPDYFYEIPYQGKIIKGTFMLDLKNMTKEQAAEKCHEKAMAKDGSDGDVNLKETLENASDSHFLGMVSRTGPMGVGNHYCTAFFIPSEKKSGPTTTFEDNSEILLDTFKDEFKYVTSAPVDETLNTALTTLTKQYAETNDKNAVAYLELKTENGMKAHHYVAPSTISDKKTAALRCKEVLGESSYQTKGTVASNGLINPLETFAASMITRTDRLGDQERQKHYCGIAFLEKPVVLMLEEIGDNKIQVIKAVRAHTDLGLKEAKEKVESAPVEITVENQEKLEALAKALHEAGATTNMSAAEDVTESFGALLQERGYAMFTSAKNEELMNMLQEKSEDLIKGGANDFIKELRATDAYKDLSLSWLGANLDDEEGVTVDNKAEKCLQKIENAALPGGLTGKDILSRESDSHAYLMSTSTDERHFCMVIGVKTKISEEVTVTDNSDALLDRLMEKEFLAMKAPSKLYDMSELSEHFMKMFRESPDEVKKLTSQIIEKKFDTAGDLKDLKLDAPYDSKIVIIVAEGGVELVTAADNCITQMTQKAPEIFNSESDIHAVSMFTVNNKGVKKHVCGFGAGQKINE